MKRLTKDRATSLIVSVSILVALLILILFATNDLAIWISPLVLGAALVTVLTFVKKRSIHSYNKQTVMIILAVSAILYLSLYYSSGIIYGFYRSSATPWTPISLISRVLPITLSILALEIIREILMAQTAFFVAPICFAIGIATDIAVSGGIPRLTSAYIFADFLGEILFPALTANLLYNYISKRYGKAPCLVYHLIMALYVHIIPIKPNVPRALPAFVLLLMPIAIRSFIGILFEKKTRRARKKSTHFGKVFAAIAVMLMLCFILLITCQFRFGLLVIATESMTGSIDRGDAIVYESYDTCRPIQENDVIVFSYNGKKTVHRVVEIHDINGQRQYITKGDANTDIDDGFRTDGDIIGLVHVKILYIGYPSLWLREAFNKNSG